MKNFLCLLLSSMCALCGYAQLAGEMITTCSTAQGRDSYGINEQISVNIDQSSPVIGCGQPVTLTATITGASEISWKRNGEFINGATTPTFTANQSGVYSVVVVSLLCQLESAPVEVVLQSPLNAAILTPSGNSACSGSGVELQATGGIAEWQWYRNGVALPDGQSLTYNAITPGQYVVVGNEGSPCESTSAPTEVIIYSLPAAIIAWQESPLICEGDSAEALANVASNQEVIWYHDEVQIATGAAQLQANLPGEYHTVVTDTLTGCSSVSASLFLEVLPLQEVEIIAQGPLSICAGQSQTLSLEVGQGAIQWQIDGVEVEGAAEPALIIFSPGTYTAEMTGDNGCVSRSNELLVEVLSLPNTTLQIDGVFPVLCGMEDTLLFTAEPGHAYQWFEGDSELTDETSNVLSISEPGVYSVSIQSFNGCSATSEAINVDAFDAPEVTIIPTGNINVCQGQWPILEATSGTGIQYSWYVDGAIIEGEQEGVLALGAEGVYRVSVIDENGCEAFSEEAVVQEIEVATPVIVDGGLTPEGQLLLTDEASGHQWYLNGEMIPGATGASYLAVLDGVYSVISIDDVCESEVSDGFEVVLGRVSEESIATKLYPNPAQDFIVIDHPLLIGTPFSVYDVAGREVLSGMTTNSRMTFDVSNLGVGMYRLVFAEGEQIAFSVVR